ncbi:MAG TPA: conjugal transfer protein [Solirubrobacteraceae bacterium]
MATTPSRPVVTLTTHPLWRLRLARELPRRLLYGLATMGLLASARVAIDPPRPRLPEALLHRPAPPDLSAEGFAVLFTRRYLTWEAGDQQTRENTLTPYVGGGLQAGVGLQPPADSEQRVQWAEVVQEREPQPHEHVYTVAAQTDTVGLLYLTVSVIRTSSGLALADYPAFVGSPAAGSARSAERLREVSEPALSAVIERALRNYLAGSASELAADLTGNAQVSMPGLGLDLQSLQSLRWAPGVGAVIATVQAVDRRGAQYTLTYELDVMREQGRWEISAIQMDPDT